MLKSILSLGTVLKKMEQQAINGGKLECILPNGRCLRYWFGCAEEQCQPQP